VRNPWLFTGGILSAIAALLHLCSIVGGPAWYRFFGAGERLARLAERKPLTPALITIAIAGMLILWSAYALSGAGVVGRLPLTRPALIAITAIYLLRAAALPIMLKTMPDRSEAFLTWSSAIVLAYGVVHVVGLASGWHDLC